MEKSTEEKPEYIMWLQVMASLDREPECSSAKLVLDTIKTGTVHPDGLEWLRSTCSRQMGTKHAIWAAEAFHRIVTDLARKNVPTVRSNVVSIRRKFNS